MAIVALVHPLMARVAAAAFVKRMICRHSNSPIHDGFTLPGRFHKSFQFHAHCASSHCAHIAWYKWTFKALVNAVFYRVYIFFSPPHRSWANFWHYSYIDWSLYHLHWIQLTGKYCPLPETWISPFYPFMRQWNRHTAGIYSFTLNGKLSYTTAYICVTSAAAWSKYLLSTYFT